MIVYVESNFVLELTFLQEECSSCQTLLELAEQRKARLVIPAFSISEPYNTWFRKATDRKQFHDKLIQESMNLSRSDPYKAFSEKANEVAGLFINSIDDDKKRLDNVMLRVLDCAEVISTTTDVLTEALQFQQLFSLKPQDSIVFASVISHLKTNQADPKCFLDKDLDFSRDSQLSEYLASLNCKLFRSFNHGLDYVNSQI